MSKNVTLFLNAMLLIGITLLAIPKSGWAKDEAPQAKSKQDPVLLFPIVQDGKWGYMDREGNVKIKPVYDQAFDFSEGLACVTTYPWRGFIDRTGKMIVQPQFTWAGSFREGVAPVRSHSAFYGRHANYYGAAASGKTANLENRIKASGFIDTKGKLIKGAPFSTSGVGEGKILGYVRKGQTRVYSIEGKKIKHDADQVCQFSNGLAAARKGHKWGFIDHAMKWVIEPQFDMADGFFEDVAFVAKSDLPYPEKPSYKTIRAWKETRKLTWGYIDKSGKLLKDYQYEDAWRFSEGFASVKITDKWGYINKSGTLEVQPTYDYAWPFSEGMGRVMIDKKQGFINAKGVLSIEPKYQPAWEFSKGLARVQIVDGKDIKEGYINKEGAYVREPTK